MSPSLPSIYTFNDTHKVRVVDLNGDPWFVAADVCKVLTLNAKYACDRLNPEEKSYVARTDLGVAPGRDMYIISESGLYNLIMRSDKPEARSFQDWVTKVVLPAIRKDGAYVVGEEKLGSGEMSEDEFVLRAMTILQKKVERITAERDKAIERAEVAEAEINFVTVDEWRALNHLYLAHGERVRLGQIAASIATSRKIQVGRQKRRIETKFGLREVVINVYPREVLNEAAAVVLPR